MSRTNEVSHGTSILLNLKEQFLFKYPPYNFAVLVYGASSGKLINSLTPHYIELPTHLENLDFKEFEVRFSDVP